MNDLCVDDFEKIESELDYELHNELEQLDRLDIELKEIGNPKKLVESISQIVWEQFILQIAGNAGNEFIKGNNNLNLSLKKADHYLDSDNFVSGKIPTHNLKHYGEYRERYSKWDSNYIDGSDHETLNGRYYREDYDRTRVKGSKTVAMDHTIPVKEIVNDHRAATFLSQDEKVSFANDTNINLKPLDAEANISKSDKAMKEWLDSTRDNKHPDERFNIDGDELRKRDKVARKEFEKLKDSAEDRALQEGMQSRIDEFKRSASITTQAVAVALFAKLTRTIFQEVILWLGEKDRKPKSLINHIKKATGDFLTDFKNNLMLASDVAVTVVLTQIFGEIVPMLRKALMFFKIGGQTLIDVGRYLKDPANRKKDTSVIVLEVGKIVTVGLTTAGGIALSAAITTGLIAVCPPLGVAQIPLLGSPAGLLGIFFGGLTAGICGAIVLHSIDGSLEGKRLSENLEKRLTIQTKILALQNEQFVVYASHVANVGQLSVDAVNLRHSGTLDDIKEALESIDAERHTENEDKFDDIFSIIDTID